MTTFSESTRLLEAVHLAAQKLASSADLESVLRDVLEICVQAVGAEGGTIYIHDPVNHKLKFAFVSPDEVAQRLERLDIPEDYGVAGEVFRSGKTVISSFPREGDPHRLRIREKTGLTVRTMITVPLAIAGRDAIGVVQLVNKRNGNFNENDSAVLDTVSDVSTLAIINSRLLAQQTRVASLEGMGRAAHDLANKAGVLTTFLADFRRNLDGLKEAMAEVPTPPKACFYLDMLETTFEDVFAPYSERVFRYARLINDLAAGKKLEPKFRKVSLGHIARESAQYLESQARGVRVLIEYEVDDTLPEIDCDDLFVIRIVENLVGNAIKAVSETLTDEWLARHRSDEEPVGRVVLRVTKSADGQVLEVEDTGPGMSPGAIRAVLGGAAASGWTRSEGSGLGTKVVLDLVQALGAKLSIDSRLGEGSKFRIVFPTPGPRLA
ncbi:MAG: GAF domain-containing sensor histidine kinase [Fimbriimonadaceae bacterium]|nr:GAF domain-containing sensor histidine kinase [Fimbriimonadaceae bacterium]QYK56949.1 MAG: GAF domain-containing sensor histidine kinase [Fimbriimonadaceae bacterium]